MVWSTAAATGRAGGARPGVGREHTAKRVDEALQYEVHRVDQGAVEVEEHVLLAGHLGVLLFARSVGGFFLGFLAGKQANGNEGERRGILFGGRGARALLGLLPLGELVDQARRRGAVVVVRLVHLVEVRVVNELGERHRLAVLCGAQSDGGEQADGQ